MNAYLLHNPSRLKAHLIRAYECYQVLPDELNQGSWTRVTDTNDQPINPHLSSSSPKSFFFQERENLFIFDGQVFRETLPKPAPFALFGVTSCDLMAIHYQDLFFAEDPYYQARRQQALLIGIDCTSPCSNGFCPTVDAGPDVKPNTADLVLHPLIPHSENPTIPSKNAQQELWLLTVHSDQGQAALEGLSLEHANTTYINQRQNNINACIDQFPNHSYITEGVQQINGSAVPAEFWEQAAIQCIGCSGCTTLCPTCSCYGTRPTTEQGSLGQQRFWDSCLYEGFQREASFHNPSQAAGERVKRFWYHKFSDDFANQFERYGCTGCGRCESTCPGVIGVHSMMKRITNRA